MATLFASLPTPVYSSTEDEPEEVLPSTEQQLSIKSTIPAQGERKGWRPSKPEDFGDGGAYPECHIAQYPLDMGRKKKVGSSLIYCVQ